MAKLQSGSGMILRFVKSTNTPDCNLHTYKSPLYSFLFHGITKGSDIENTDYLLPAGLITSTIFSMTDQQPPFCKIQELHNHNHL